MLMAWRFTGDEGRDRWRLGLEAGEGYWLERFERGRYRRFAHVTAIAGPIMDSEDVAEWEDMDTGEIISVPAVPTAAVSLETDTGPVIITVSSPVRRARLPKRH